MNKLEIYVYDKLDVSNQIFFFIIASMRNFNDIIIVIGSCDKQPNNNNNKLVSLCQCAYKAEG